MREGDLAPAPKTTETAYPAVRGRPNKIIACELKISVRTVKSYRAHLFRRLGVRSVAEAVRIALAVGVDGR
ncbi:MAG: LuxR C-terminal-related transcriptional regulator [Allosphingosinicella sp.]